MLSHVWLFVTPWTIAPRLLSPWAIPGKNTEVGSHSLLQGILLAQGLNLGLLHCRQILYHLSHQGSPLKVFPNPCLCFPTLRVLFSHLQTVVIGVLIIPCWPNTHYTSLISHTWDLWSTFVWGLFWATKPPPHPVLPRLYCLCRPLFLHSVVWLRPFFHVRLGANWRREQHFILRIWLSAHKCLLSESTVLVLWLFNFLIFFFFFFATLHGMWDLKSLTRDWTCALCLGRAES